MTIKETEETNAAAPTPTAPPAEPDIPVTTAVELPVTQQPNAQQMHRGDGLPTITIPTTATDDPFTVVATVHKPTPTSRVGMNMRTDRNGQLFVSNVSHRGLVATQSELEPSMRIVSVNGVPTQGRTPAQVRDMITDAQDEITVVATKVGVVEDPLPRQQKNQNKNSNNPQSRSANTSNNNNKNNTTDDCCLDCCIWYPGCYCSPNQQHDCCQLCCLSCLSCENGCSAVGDGVQGLGDDANCDCCDVCCSSGCEVIGCCDWSCCDMIFNLLGAVPV